MSLTRIPDFLPYLWMRKYLYEYELHFNLHCCHDQAFYFWELFLDFLILDYAASYRG